MATPAITLRWAGLTIPSAASLKGAPAEARQLTAAGARSIVPVVYGYDRLGGLMLNILQGTGAYAAHVLAQVLWCHECDGIDTVRLGNEALPSGTTTWHYTGNQTTTNAALVAAFTAQGVTYAETLNGYAYSVIALPVVNFNGKLDFSARIKGRRVYISRLDSTLPGGSGSHLAADPATWAWTDNPVDCLCDWLTSKVYGASETVDYVNTWTAAYECDEDLDAGAGVEKRRVLNIALTTPASLWDAMETLRAHAGCWVLPGAAGLKMLPDTTASSVAAYAHESGNIAGISPLQVRDLGNTPTAVEVIYTDAREIPYRDGSAVVSLSGAGTTLPWRLSTVRMVGVNRYSQAYREAAERLAKLQLADSAIELDLFDVGVRHEVGDVVTVSHPVGLSSALYRVAGVQMADHGAWRLFLNEYSSSVYSDVIQSPPAIAAISGTIRPLPAIGSLLGSMHFEDERFWSSLAFEDGWSFESITDPADSRYLNVPKQLTIRGGIVGSGQRLCVSDPVESPPPGTRLRLAARMVNNANQTVYAQIWFYDREISSYLDDITIAIAPGAAAQDVWGQGVVPNGATAMVFVAVNAGGSTWNGNAASMSGIKLELAAGTDLLAPDAATEVYQSTATGDVTVTGAAAAPDGFADNTQLRSVTFTPDEDGIAVVSFEGLASYTGTNAGRVRWSIQQVGGTWSDGVRLVGETPAGAAGYQVPMTSQRTFTVSKDTAITVAAYACKAAPGDTLTVANGRLRVEVIKR